MAALAGSYYFRNARPHLKSTKYLVLFLWITVLVEFIAGYVIVGFYSDYTYFSFIKDTPFQSNYWLYNIFHVIGFSFFCLYFASFLKKRSWKTLVLILTTLVIVVPGVYVFFTPSFFEPTSQILAISRTLLLFFSIVLFYFELLRSDLLLEIKTFLPFYISVGVLVFNLCVTPLDILFNYFNIVDGNELFVKLRLNVLLYANVFMYVTFIAGFLICSRKKKSY